MLKLSKAIFFSIVLCLLSAGAIGQTPPAKDPAGTFKAWEETLARIEKLVLAPSTTVSMFEQRREDVRRIFDNLRKLEGPAQKDVQRVRELLKAMGAPPKDGEPQPGPEAELRRKELGEQLARAEGQFNLIAVAIRRADGLLDRIDEKRSELIRTRLLMRGPSIWKGVTWVKALSDARAIRGTAFAAADRWWRDKVTGPARPFHMPVLGILILLAAFVLGLLLRRWLRSRQTAFDGDADTGFAPRLLAAIAKAAASGVPPALMGMAAYGALELNGLLTGPTGDTIVGGLIGLLAFFVVWSASRGTFRPTEPGRALVSIAPGNATILHRLASALGAVLGSVLFFEWATDEFFVSRDLMAVSGLFAHTGMALILFSATRGKLWRSPTEGTAAPQGAGEGRKHSWFWHLIRHLTTFAAVVVILSVVLDYYRLGQFVLFASLLTLAVVGIATIARILVRVIGRSVLGAPEGEKSATMAGAEAPPDDAQLVRFWINLFADVAILIGAGIALLLTWGFGWQSLERLVERAWTGLRIGKYTVALGDVMVAVIAFAVLIFVVRWLQRNIDERIHAGTRLDKGVRKALSTGIGYTGVLIAALVAISLAGFDFSNLAIIAGALSVGIGFGLQAIVNNFVSGIIILAERPFKEGDWVVSASHEGIVKRIGIRATEIRTFQNASVLVPNSTLITLPVVNWQHKDSSGRLDIAVGVAYGSDTELVRKLLFECAGEHPKVLRRPEPQVWFMNFGNSSLDFELRVFIANVLERFEVTSELRFAIDRTFRQAKIVIAFPQRDIHIKSDIQKAAPRKRGRGSKD